ALIDGLAEAATAWVNNEPVPGPGSL
ncbi:MAG: hypothetical protein ACI8XD_001628, partial [Thermoproteota archaeon]